ncbi:hypothetical protein [Burkholderia ambifaria]|uniref:Rhs element Vgr protein n=1 Tax=Burkholderia ambifaria MEX-5 TaxID=396597 RepID=B1T4F0_9BURK|nr:hypothetical protein [Burkholderia ambifaria]EDT41548.1 hypothetical protein BamMEX5DRAFT_2666 [Burkholderia ambifaria MEX-5]
MSFRNKIGSALSANARESVPFPTAEKMVSGKNTIEHLLECDIRVKVAETDLPDIFKGLCIVKGVSTRFAVNEIPGATIELEVRSGGGSSLPVKGLSNVMSRCPAGASVSIDVRNKGIQTWKCVFRGVLEHVECEWREQASTVKIKARHELAHLQSVWSGKAFQDKSDFAVLQELMGKGDLRADASKSLMTTRDQTIQWPFGASRWEFSKALMGRNGVCFWPDVNRWLIAPPGWSESVITANGNNPNVLRVNCARSTRQQPRSSGLVQWNVQQQMAVAAQGVSSLKAQGCFDPGNIKSLATSDSHIMDSGWLAPNSGVALKGKVNGLALLAALGAARGVVGLRGCVMAKVGDVLRLVNCGEASSGESPVTAIEHVFGTAGSGDCTTTITVGLAPGVAALVPLSGPDGAVVGCVQAYEPDKSRKGWNEVWVKVPGIDGKVRARYSGPYASQGAAAWFYPQKGDEVVLMPMAGDPCSLVMVGAMNNPVNALPEGWSANIEDKRGIAFHKNATSLCLRFDRKDGKIECDVDAGNSRQHVAVDSRKGMLFDVKSGDFAVNVAKGEVALDAMENDLHLRAKGYMRFNGDRGVQLTSRQGSLALSAKSTMKLGAQEIALVAGQSKINLAQASVSTKAISIIASGEKDVSIEGGATSKFLLDSAGGSLKGPQVEIDGLGAANVKSPIIGLKP